MPKPVKPSWDGEREDGRTYNPIDGNWETDEYEWSSITLDHNQIASTMAIREDVQYLQIEELISEIKKLTNEHLRWGSNTISDINSRLHHLRDFLSDEDETLDILSAVDDFIENISSDTAHYFSTNKLLLKKNTIRLEEECEHLKQKKNLYQHLFSMW
jgi:hypothetical protein